MHQCCLFRLGQLLSLFRVSQLDYLGKVFVEHLPSSGIKSAGAL